MRERSDRFDWTAPLAAGLLTLSCLPGCGSSHTTSPMSEADRRRAAELGLSDEAVDPTQQDRRAGYGVWREAPEPAGTDNPKSPDRRNLPWD